MAALNDANPAATAVMCDSTAQMANYFFIAIQKEIAEFLETKPELEVVSSWDTQFGTIKLRITDGEDAGMGAVEDLCNEYAELFNTLLAEDCDGADACDQLTASCVDVAAVEESKREAVDYTASIQFENSSNSVAVGLFALLSVLSVFFL
eukprot:TRINITY_DN2753_c0_g1_i1.p2 TRINITY_DN2753_c0_g1~~TRINITY_DN2753_c0_g1_i1.p2  ORF type:complete len:150 (-),score=56.52 TRINITY_DN2753_c0_g1_i1:37-486(-)